jgi:hypothetical protein
MSRGDSTRWCLYRQSTARTVATAWQFLLGRKADPTHKAGPYAVGFGKSFSTPKFADAFIDKRQQRPPVLEWIYDSAGFHVFLAPLSGSS